MSAQVTEAHRAITESVCELLDSEEMVGPSPAERAAQLIADSEAKATAQANAQVESLISSAKNAIPASEHPAEPTVKNWAWQIRNLGDDRRLVYAERNQLRAEVERLREWQAGVIANEREHHAERKDAIVRAERAEADLATAKAIIASIEEDGTEEHNAAVRLRQELATERQKVRALTAILESICEEWGRNHDAPFCAGSEMEKLASKALEKLEEAT